VGPVTAQGRVDLWTAKVAAVNYALLTLVLRPTEPLSERQFDAVVIAVAVLLAHAQRRAGGDRE
jgi:hypothetical protein